MPKWVVGMDDTNNGADAAAAHTLTKDDSVIYVGKKGAMGYVIAVVTSFERGATEVSIKARGTVISRLVDVEEILKHRFLPTLKVKEVRFATDRMVRRDGREMNVSSMEIIVTK